VFAGLWQWIYQLSISESVRASSWIFPVLECIHLYSMVFLVGLVGAFDLRLMGASIDNQPLSQLSRFVARWVWIPFVINAITGTLLFGSKAPEYTANPAFEIKMALIFIGLIYHYIVIRKARGWDHFPIMPVGIRVLGGLSLAIWIGVISSSRWIAYLY
jgi:hypothetical protein